MKSHSVIFIDQPMYERFDKNDSRFGFAQSFLTHLDVTPRELPRRIYTSFLPPILGDKSKKIYVDLIGPLLAVTILALLLVYGNSYKHPSAAVQTSPILTILYYSVLMPSICYFLVRLGGSSLGLADIVAVIGYGLYGHVFTITASLFFDNEQSNLVFFLMMTVFGGLSVLRIVLVLLLTIPRPPARLLVCSLVSIVHLLFLVFVHFAYMHRTFVYGKDSSIDY